MRILALVPLAVLAACGPPESDPAPGRVTVGEAKALDEAAEMLDQRRLPPKALPSQTQPSARTSTSTSATGEAQ